MNTNEYDQMITRPTGLSESHAYIEKMKAETPAVMKRLMSKGLKMVQDKKTLAGPARAFVFRREVTFPCSHHCAPRIVVIIREDEIAQMSPKDLADRVEIECDTKFSKEVCTKC